jgi:hypothetical protein
MKTIIIYIVAIDCNFLSVIFSILNTRQDGILEVKSFFFYSVYCTVNCSCTVLCLLVMYVLVP